ncbi:MAG: hypothetical protein AVDCRST_MAG08-4305, partial [uncultured Acetobacteraceae bacterium]
DFRVGGGARRAGSRAGLGAAGHRRGRRPAPRSASAVPGRLAPAGWM